MTEQQPPEFGAVLRDGDRWAVGHGFLVVANAYFPARIYWLGGKCEDIVFDAQPIEGPSWVEMIEHVREQMAPDIKPSKREHDHDKPWRRWPIRR